MAETTTRRTDEQIQRDVLAELEWDTRVRPNEIGVSVEDGVVTLSGWTDSFIKKWAAERAALRVRGVRAVANEIEVRLPGTAERTDPEIAAAARRALDWAALVPDGKVKVTVSKGWVTVEGAVESQYQRRAAERAVRGLPGVRGVTNLIVVRPPEQVPETELKRRIEEALVRSAETDADRIQVEVRGDRIVLSGKVRSWAERREAERVAWSAPGVTEVDNLIRIAP
jgi:osmotically-inducible protein OsmY